MENDELIMEMIKMIKEDISEFRKDVKKLIEKQPLACDDCAVALALAAHIQDHKDEEEAKTETKKFRWDVAAIIVAGIAAVGSLLWQIFKG